jgi:hypothetical protein
MINYRSSQGKNKSENVDNISSWCNILTNHECICSPSDSFSLRGSGGVIFLWRENDKRTKRKESNYIY